MRDIGQTELDTISGGANLDWKGLPVAAASALAGAGIQWYNGYDWLSPKALMWGAVGGVVGALGFYGTTTALDYLTED